MKDRIPRLMMQAVSFTTGWVRVYTKYSARLIEDAMVVQVAYIASPLITTTCKNTISGVLPWFVKVSLNITNLADATATDNHKVTAMAVKMMKDSRNRSLSHRKSQVMLKAELRLKKIKKAGERMMGLRYAGPWLVLRHRSARL